MNTTPTNKNGASPDFIQLYNFTEMKLAAARGMARSGNKDQARDWQRFFFNSRLVEILCQQNWGDGPYNPQFLRGELERLHLECHPAHEASYKDDLNRIADQMDGIALGISMLLTTAGVPK